MSDYVFTMYRADKFYGSDRQVLANISLSFLPGAKIGVLGPNGAGKSTLLRAISKLIELKDGKLSGVFHYRDLGGFHLIPGLRAAAGGSFLKEAILTAQNEAKAAFADDHGAGGVYLAHEAPVYPYRLAEGELALDGHPLAYDPYHLGAFCAAFPFLILSEHRILLSGSCLVMTILRN